MKIPFRLGAVLLTAALLVGLLVSCTEGSREISTLRKIKDARQRASAVLEAADAKADAADSYQANMTASTDMAVKQQTFSMEVKIRERVIGAQTADSLVHRSETTVSLTAAGSDAPFYTTAETTGYENGRMYSSIEGEAQLYTDGVSCARYREYKENAATVGGRLVLSDLIRGCEQIDCIYERKTGFRISASGQSATQLLELSGLFDFSWIEGDYRLRDVAVSCSVGNDLYPTALTLEFQLEGAQKSIPSERILLAADFGCWNETPVPEPIDFTAFEEADDLWVLDDFERALEVRRTMSEGVFHVKTRLVIDQQESIEEDFYRLGMSNGKLTYTCMITLDDAEGEISYANKQKTMVIRSGGEDVSRKSQRSDDATEKAWIRVQMDPAGYSRERVRDIQRSETAAGVFYDLTLDGANAWLFDSPLYGQQYTDGGCREYLRIAVDGERLTAYRYTIARTVYLGGIRTQMAMICEVWFDD